MPTVENDKTETEEEEMEQEIAESDKSTDDESGSVLTEQEEDETDLDEEECEQRRSECLDDMAELERQFSELKEQLYRERMTQLDAKLEEVRAGRAQEYLNPLAQLQENMRIRTQVAGVLKDMRITTIHTCFRSEEYAAFQNLQSEKVILYDTLKMELEDKIRRLEEDRNNIDISSDLWNESESMKKKRKSDSWNSSRRRKPVTVTGPFIVYMLQDKDIIEDFTTIKKAMKRPNQTPKRRTDSFSVSQDHS